MYGLPSNYNSSIEILDFSICNSAVGKDFFAPPTSFTVIIFTGFRKQYLIYHSVFSSVVSVVSSTGVVSAPISITSSDVSGSVISISTSCS